ncbi:hypothetical protein [Mucilaginibacter jinjuensis]|uniref:Uncharacterized protein n=1 Tax=Mucilaginibacter jinjuensis TaxID=1176721 RepID=A0ABY7TBE5_9SPHI|nr:hypothetical protein [Mucilaginibacter jinjuensis]WCT13771.1 hypothetical protein PQO05_07465 [Mucilaginibacter jinjuensis]
MKKITKILALGACLFAITSALGSQKAVAVDACSTYCQSDPTSNCIVTYIATGTNVTCYYCHSKPPYTE